MFKAIALMSLVAATALSFASIGAKADDMHHDHMMDHHMSKHDMMMHHKMMERRMMHKKMMMMHHHM